MLRKIFIFLKKRMYFKFSAVRGSHVLETESGFHYFHFFSAYFELYRWPHRKLDLKKRSTLTTNVPIGTSDLQSPAFAQLPGVNPVSLSLAIHKHQNKIEKYNISNDRSLISGKLLTCLLSVHCTWYINPILHECCGYFTHEDGLK